MEGIVLYHAVASRAFTALWLLEELGVPYRLEPVDLRQGAQRQPDYLRINPMGKVPALTDGPVMVSEIPAICLYAADRYGYGSLAPAVDAPERGAYLRWTVFSTAVLEPAIYLPRSADERASFGAGWGNYDRALGVLEQALDPGPYLLGERFTAADVALGGVFSVAMFNKRLPDRPVFAAYDERLKARPAYQRAVAVTWPPELFSPA